MVIKPMPPYFIIRISREAKKNRKKSIGSILFPETEVFMRRNMQAGEIVAIGEDAALYFPEARIGDILLVHHFCEDTNDHEAKLKHLIDQTEDYNYYLVTACEVPGRRCETYGVWNGKEIIPHPEFIFLSCDKPPINDLSPEEFINQATEEKNGIVLFKEWKEAPEDIRAKMKRIKLEIQSMAQTKMNDQLKHVIWKKEQELARLSREVNDKKLEEHTVVAINDSYNNYITECFGGKIMPGDKAVFLNLACHTTIEFNGTEYRIVPTNYCFGPSSWYKKAVQSFLKEPELV